MPAASTRFIAPQVLARIAGLELLARGVVEGFLAGLHRSPYKGFSVDFMEYRPYTPGDDLQRVDWKVFARTDRYYVKEFEGETNARLHLLVDSSASMGYSSEGPTKLEYACFLAGSLAYLISRQGDAVGLTTFDVQIRSALAARAGKAHLFSILGELENAAPAHTTALGKPLHEIADLHNRRGFMVLISDLLADPEPLVDALKHFRFLGHEVLVFHVLDPQEVQFEFSDVIELQDLETDERIIVDGKTAQQLYRDNFSQYSGRIRKACGQLGVDYAQLQTSEPLDRALFNYLSARSRRTV